jgi:phosphoglycerate dehydrogenase-like enzyme
MSRSPSNNNSLTIQQYDPFQDGYKQPDYDRWISFDKVLVIGLGQLGLPVAKYVKDRGFDVYGYDISTKALECVVQSLVPYSIYLVTQRLLGFIVSRSE